MSGSEQYSGDLKKHSVSIDGKDITNFISVAHVFQDIYTPFWSAQVLFIDTNNLLMNMPIKPGAKMEIYLESDFPTSQAGSKKFVFYVYKISDRAVHKQESQSYILHGISNEFWNNEKVRISKAFSGKTPDEIVNELVQNIGGTLETADIDPLSYDVLIPNWSPITGIEWVTRFTKSAMGGADFVFYQSDTSKYKFRSLEKMLTDRSGIEFRQVNPNTRTTGSTSEEEETFFNIEKYEFLHQHDAVRNMQTGYYANQILTHDIISKTITTTDYNYGDDIPDDAMKAPWDSHLFKDAELSNISYFPVHPSIRNGVTPEETVTNWAGSRKSNLMKFEENRLVAQVNGFGKMWEILGKSVNIQLPSHQDIDETQINDKYYKGNYVVTAIKHAISFGKYRAVLELGKKRLDKPYE